MPVRRPRTGVADPGGFGGEVVVADEHAELDRGAVIDVDPAQRVRQGAGSIGNDEHVADFGFGVAWVEIGDAAHRSPGR